LKRTVFLIGIPFLVTLYFGLIISSKGCNYVMANHPDKLVDFNHKSHLSKYFPENGMSKDDCTICHDYYPNGRFKGLPTVAECTSCHDPNAPDKSAGPNAARRKPMLQKFKDTDKPWGSFAKQPGLVYFSHKVVMTAKYEDGRLKARCGSCHGDKAESTSAAMITGKMLMGQCEDCHTALHISNKCAVCHD
jgi:menaquinone reductase, multiheme cytochrome c subunit